MPAQADFRYKHERLTNFPDRIEQVANELGLHLEDAQTHALSRFLDLLLKWNSVYNLTALRDAEEMLTHHLFDSLAVVLPLQRELASLKALSSRISPSGTGEDVSSTGHSANSSPQLLDVGSGAGLPGIVLAVCCPSLSVTCVDAVAKKAAFVQQVTVDLQLRNLRSIHTSVGPAQVLEWQKRFDIICSRAFASLADFTKLTAHLLCSGGAWMALKGKPPLAEMNFLDPGVAQVFHVEHIQVPLLHEDRCIVWMRAPVDSGKTDRKPA